MQILIILIFFSCYPEILFAYIGPGMAGGIILSILGIILAIVISLFGILYFPIKRYLEKIKKKKNKKKA